MKAKLTLLKISGTVGAQPTVDAVRHSLAVLIVQRELSDVPLKRSGFAFFPCCTFRGHRRSERENKLQRGIAD